MNVAYDYDAYVNYNRQRRNHFVRDDPRINLTDAGVMKNFRFSSANIDQITDLLRPQLEHLTMRGNPMSPEQQVCKALHHYGSQPFQRTTGLSFNVSQSAARTAIMKVTEALLLQKEDWIKLPLYHVQLALKNINCIVFKSFKSNQTNF